MKTIESYKVKGRGFTYFLGSNWQAALETQRIHGGRIVREVLTINA